MQMAVVAGADAVFLQRGHDLRGADAGVHRRIMQEHQLFQPRLGSVQAHAQAADLAVHHLFVVRLPHIEQPAPGTADGITLHGVGVVVQDVQRIKPFCLEIGGHLVGRGPPVIMVALHDDLLPRQALQEGKVPAGIGQAHGPADVTRQHDGVLRLDELPPVFFQTLHIIVPARKDIHRLGSAQRKMGVAKHKKCHVVTPVLTVQQGVFYA